MSDRFKILIVDDEPKICGILSEILEGKGYHTCSALNGATALEKLEQCDIDLVLLDIKLPDTNGIDLLKQIKNRNPEVAIIMISAFGTVSSAVEALKSGAEDFIEKPLETNRVLTTIHNIREKLDLRKQRDLLESEIVEKYRIIGTSNEIKKVMSFIDKIAPTNSTVLILGESGVGKELVARAIHFKSERVSKPFIKVNCAALPGELIESELFGYEKGAFTGAHAKKLGQFEIANQGTLFLDEIGDMSLQAQSKVLRAIEDGEILRLGAIKTIHVDVRFVCATNHNLRQLIEQKKFREDLFHRINVLTITVPPLRTRKNDIKTLAVHFLKQSCVENNRPIKELTKKALQYLEHQDWPGNVRELKHLMEKLALLTEEQQIDPEDISSIIKTTEKEENNKEETQIEKAKAEFEKNLIIEVLNKTGWHISKVAKKLGIDRSTLFRKMKKLGIKK